MPTTLTLTPDPSTASVVLAIDGLPTDDVPVITRTDVNGTVPVRLRVDEAPIAGFLQVRDHEAALLGAVTYEVQTSPTEQVSDSTSLDLTGPARIHSVQYPTIATVPDNLTGYDATRQSSSVVHWPQGRPDPIVIDSPARTRTGALTAFAASHAAATDVQVTLRSGQALMLRQSEHPGMDMYFRVTDSRIEPLELLEGGWAWAVVADYVETRPPALPLLGSAGWTFDDITAGYASFSAVRAAFDDFAALTLGPEFTS